MQKPDSRRDVNEISNGMNGQVENRYKGEGKRKRQFNFC